MASGARKTALVLQHVPFEGPGAIDQWLTSNGYNTRTCHLYRNDPLPAAANVDFVVVMGGPMNIYQEQEYPFLAREKAFLGSAVSAGTPVVGVCLGAQLLADVLGAPVTRNEHTEIGWFPVWPASDHPMAQLFHHRPEVLHWHGDTFALPEGAIGLLASEACDNQAFLYNDHVLGLQFHLEMTTGGIRAICDACASELVPAPWIQDADTLAQPRHLTALHQTLFALLDAISANH